MIRIIAWMGAILMGSAIYIGIFWAIPLAGGGTLWAVLGAHAMVGVIAWGGFSIVYLMDRGFKNSDSCG